MPARNSRPSETSAATAYRIIVIDGGSRMPSVPPAAMMPAAKPGEYPRLRISGIPALPIAEHVAGLEPAIAANSAQVNTLAMPSPPGTRCIHACIAR